MMSKESQWKTSTGFILASAGSAIGLGAMWKFPYMAGIYGGGAFYHYFYCSLYLWDYLCLLWNLLLVKWDVLIRPKYTVN